MKLVGLPIDLLLLIIGSLDSCSITKLSATCKKLKNLIQSFSNLIYKKTADRELQLSSLPPNIESYHQLVLVHEALRRRRCFPIDSEVPKKVPRSAHFLLAWPVHEGSAYMIALSRNHLIWVDTENMKRMNVKDLSCHDWEKDKIINRDYTLKGHNARIGLILANNDGLLVSFDISCDIYVWNVELKKLDRKINTRTELGMIMSMNLHQNYVVCAGINGKIAVWDASNGNMIHSFLIPSTYLDVLDEHQLNVSIFGDRVAFGLSDGKFYIYGLSEKKILMEFDVTKEKSPRMRRHEDESNVLTASNVNNPPQEFQANADLDMENDNNFEENNRQDFENESNTPSEGMQIQIEQNSDTDSEGSDMDIFPLHDSAAPLTLSLSSHYLLTNGPEPSCLALWGLKEERLLGFLDEARISRFNSSRTGPLRFAEVSLDGSMIYSVSGDLMVWNFRDLRHSESKGIHRHFSTGQLATGDEVWIGYETHETI